MRQYRFDLFADYYQFYIQDETATTDLSESWTNEAADRMLAVAPGMIGVGTVRNTNVPVLVDVADSLPDESGFESWDQVNECCIDIPSGRLVIAGCTDYFPDAARIEVQPGTYRVRVFYGKLESLKSALEGEDNYRLVLWQAPAGPVTVLKQRPTSKKSV